MADPVPADWAEVEAFRRRLAERLDKETIDQKREQGFDAPGDAEVTITFGTLRLIEIFIEQMLKSDAVATALCAARDNALEEAAASADAEADRLDAKADESEANGEDLMGDQQSFAAFILRNRAARIRSLKSPSSASTKGEGNG